MIGLGSNRLSVCRRGGMSVTQAGRGGMEWLAGNGWRRESPYSAAATAALKAQFPTQWPTIRDYGFAHPALVPFINEDPMLVMSLIEGLGTRWLVSNSTSPCLLNTHIIPTADDEIIYSFKHSGTNCLLIQSNIGKWNDSNPNNHWVSLKSDNNDNNSYTVWMFSSNTKIFTLQYNTAIYRADFVFDIKNRTVTGTTNGSTKTYTNIPRYYPASNQPPVSIGHSNSNAYTEIYQYKHYRNDVLIGDIVPFKREDGTVGGLNILTAEYCEPISGSFTISETPAS